MDIAFDRGSNERPKGHALLYFRSSSDPDEIWVTYLVILPITVDVSKYVPPFLMNQVGEMGPKDLSAFAFPPAPERIEGYGALEEMAELRNDDIISAGRFDPNDVPSAMMSINDAVQRYAEIYSQVAGGVVQAEGEQEEDAGEFGVNEVLFSLMSESDKLSELTKLVGSLRFAVEGSDETMTRETEDSIGLLSKHLPENHNIQQLVEAVKSSDSRSAELADLYLQRCYHLVQEEYAKLGQIEAKIRDVEASRPSE